MKQEHQPKDVKIFNKGANRDVDPEILGSVSEGEFMDAHNMSPSSTNSKREALEKIKGETLIHPSTTLSGDYISLGAISVNEKLFEVWVDDNQVEPPIIRIDGVEVAKSDEIPFTKDYPLQMDKNESCVGGEVFLTDYNSPPMIFNLQDMIDSLASDPDKYFSDFNSNIYSVNLTTPLNIPVFVDLVNVGGGGGLPVGNHQYSIRLVTTDGERTNWSPYTPLIPVVQNFSSTSTEYPYSKTYGGPAAPTSKTKYAIKLRFRVTNFLNYDSVEIKRRSFDSGAGVDFLPSEKIIGRVDIEEQEIEVKEFLDPSNSNVDEAVPDDETENDFSFIQGAKTLRYHDKKLVLMNVKTASKDTSGVTFKEINGKKVFPIMDKLNKEGFNDPYYHTYRKAFMHNEKYGFAVNVFDGIGARGFATAVTGFENYQMPSRRNEPDADSLLYSYRGTVKASNTSHSVSQTFEVFDHDDAVGKSDICNFKNILDAGNRGLSKVTEDCPNNPEDYGATIGTLNEVKPPYKPYRPTSENDSVDTHDYRPNTKVDNGNLILGQQSYNPLGFGLNYYSLGVAFSGLSNLPNWAKAFTVARTEPAGRVITQGIGMYKLNQGDFDLIGNSSLMTKDLNKMWAFFPDIKAGLISSGTLDDIEANPGNYKIQFVSPVGFFSEMYNFEHDTLNPSRSRIVDFISYARVLYDNGQINPTEDSGMGVNDGSGNRYVAYKKWRNISDSAGGSPLSSGDNLVGISDFTSKTSGRGDYYELTLDQNIYNHGSYGGTAERDFEDLGCKNFNEPYYIIQIIQEGAQVETQNVNEYQDTGTYVKLESIIGAGNNLANQSFLLVDERWEDCIPDLSQTGGFALRDSFVTLRDEQEREELWINVTFKTSGQIATIHNDIQTNGSHTTAGGKVVKGMYRHRSSTQSSVSPSGLSVNDRFWYLVFDQYAYFPTDEQKVVVKYDNTMPIRVFGGDTTVGESLFAPIDNEADASDNGKDTQFTMNGGMPFRQFKNNPRHYIVVDTKGVNKIQDELQGRLGFIRQYTVMFTCQSRISLPLAHNADYPLQYFPLVHYVMRPNRFDDSQFGSGAAATYSDNNMFAEYEDDYGDEYLNWKYGGFRFLPQTNSDFATKSPIEFFSKPAIGFVEKNVFCTRVWPSLARSVNSQDTPGLRTFLALNAFDISDDQGEIKFAWDDTTGKGENLYAITERGICLLLTNKDILSDAGANQLGTLSTDNFIQKEYWVEKNIGMNGETWRSAQEASIPTGSEGGGTVRRKALFFANKYSAYVFFGDLPLDIAKGKYFSKINPKLSAIADGYGTKMTSGYDSNHDEYYMHVDDKLFVYSAEKAHFVGTYAYNFDEFVSHKNNIYGLRDLESYKLREGTQINGANIEGYVIQASSPQRQFEKEFIRIQVNSDNKPVSVEFMDKDENVLCSLNQANQGARYLKDYDGWEQFIPRKDVSVDPNRGLVQDRLLIYKIIHNLAEDFVIKDVLVQHKILK